MTRLIRDLMAALRAARNEWRHRRQLDAERRARLTDVPF